METTLHPLDKFTAQIEHSISRGIDYLYHHQYPNGEFCVYMSGDDPMQGWNQPDSSIFPSALIGSSLTFLGDYPGVNEMLNKTAWFLKSQIGRGATWNHYTNAHRLKSLCPQDVDDTACVSSLLQKCRIDFPENTSLLLDNRRKDGLFYTWFAWRLQVNSNKTYWRLALKEFLHPVQSFRFWRKMECKRDDVDAVVNANVLYYLGDIKETQPIIKWMLETITDRKEANCDKWYRNIFTVYYFFSRNYHAGIHKLEPFKTAIIDRILARSNGDGSFGDGVVDTSLAICSLLNLGFQGDELTRGVRFLIASQTDTGEWQRWRIYYGGPQKVVGFGSEELSTAFCLEALARFKKSIR